MKFKIDENLPNDIIGILKAAGHEAFSVHQENMSGADASLASLVVREKLCLITLDLGFGDIRTYPPAQYHGLIILRIKKQDKHAILSLVQRLIPLFETEAVTGRLWIVEDDRIRLRGEEA